MTTKIGRSPEEANDRPTAAGQRCLCKSPVENDGNHDYQRCTMTPSRV